MFRAGMNPVELRKSYQDNWLKSSLYHNGQFQPLKNLERWTLRE